jgi:hypothetical protein
MAKSTCEDKMAFDTKIEAENAVSVVRYQRGSDLKVYKCSNCGLWHLSSKYGDRNDD